MPEATFAGHVVLPDGSQRPVHFVARRKSNAGLFKDTQLPGDYSIVVSASDGATALGETRARFIVYDLDLEMENSAPRAGPDGKPGADTRTPPEANGFRPRSCRSCASG